jgi:hypothetical protein
MTEKLSNLEIIKAFFMLQIYLSGASKERTEEYIIYLEDELSKIYKQIVRIDLDEDEVLNYYWRATSGKGFYSEEVVRGIKDKLSSLKTDKPQWIKDFVSGLSQAFHTVETIEKSSDSTIRDLLFLNNMSIAYPFFIKTYKLKAPEKAVQRLACLLENLTFRYLVRGGRAEIEARLNSHLVNFNSVGDIDKNIENIIHNLKNSGYWAYWNDQSLTGYLNGHFYGNRVDIYVLWKYELYLCDDNHPVPHKVSFKDLIKRENIEHIAPRTETAGGAVAAGYGVYKDEQHPEESIESGEWLNCLGNLMLISGSHNSSIGNKPFSEKLDSYGKANLLNQQREVINFISDPQSPVWDKTAIERRLAAIVVAASAIWSLDAI